MGKAANRGWPGLGRLGPALAVHQATAARPVVRRPAAKTLACVVRIGMAGREGSRAALSALREGQGPNPLLRPGQSGTATVLCFIFQLSSLVKFLIHDDLMLLQEVNEMWAGLGYCHIERFLLQVVLEGT
ncbi:uncharacterized protein [Miscanthus floridulus]|uniref:uncharacterized protein isoform X1 n=1 Tax=Miscanthus floridulus TaxID=154761 RepID=UPI003458E002